MTNTGSTTQRQRLVTWDDPDLGLAAVRRLSGVEYFAAMARREVPEPPFARLLGIGRVEAASGAVTFWLEPAEYHYNPLGTMQGGMIAALFDGALGAAIQTALPVGTALTTVDLHVTFTRPVTVATGTVRCAASVQQTGRRMATATARLLDAAGTLYAHATTTCLLLRSTPELE